MYKIMLNANGNTHSYEIDDYILNKIVEKGNRWLKSTCYYEGVNPLDNNVATFYFDGSKYCSTKILLVGAIAKAMEYSSDSAWFTEDKIIVNNISDELAGMMLSYGWREVKEN